MERRLGAFLKLATGLGVLAAALVLLVFKTNAQEEKLYCAFDEGLECSGGVGPVEMEAAIFKDSLFGRAVTLYPNGCLAYATAGVLNENEGSVEFLAQPSFEVGGEGEGDQVLFQLYKNEGSRLNLVLREGSYFELRMNGAVAYTGSYSWKPGEWHFFVITYGRRGARLFIDSDLVAEIKKETGGLPSLPERFYLGSRFNCGLRANFYFDELRVFPSELTHNEVAVAMKKIHYSRHVGGEIEVVPDRVVAGRWGRLEIRYRLDREIPLSGGVRFVAKHYNDWANWQTGNSKGDNYVTVYVEGYRAGVACRRAPHHASARYCEVWPLERGWPAGTVVRLVLGETAEGSRGTRFPRVANEKTPINILVNDGSGYFFETEEPAWIRVKGGEAVRLVARGRSRVKVGEEYRLTVWAEDYLRNPNKEFRGVVSVVSEEEGVVLSPPHEFTPADKGRFVFRGIYFDTPGIKTLKVRTPGLPEETSNPVEVVEDYGEKGQIFWGDIHGHTRLSDGTGDLESYFEFARDYAALDFAAVSDHNPHPGSGNINPSFYRNYLDEDDWERTKAVVRSFNKPGEFVSIVGQEGTYGDAYKIGECVERNNCRGAYSNPSDPTTGHPDWGQGPENWGCYQRPECVNIECPEVEGDWHVYFNSDDPPLITPDTVEEFFEEIASWKWSEIEKGNSFPVFVMASHGGRQGLMSLLDLPIVQSDPDLVAVAEIISVHISSPCSFESWVQNGLRRARLGIMASGDDHSGQPGRSPMRSGQGYIAVYAPVLTREAIFEAIKERRVYAYSHGDRAIVEFSIDTGTGEVFMGGEGVVYEGNRPKIDFRVVSRKGVKRIELIKNGEVVASTERDSHGVVEERFSFVDESFDGEAYYYVKVVHQNWGTSWSSPIWLRPVEFARGDLDRDGDVDREDVFKVLLEYGEVVEEGEKRNSVDFGWVRKDW